MASDVYISLASETPSRHAIHFSSLTDCWATPQHFFDELNREFSFTLDVCALPENTKCDRFFSPEVDGLKQKWSGVCWMNPPYGRVIGKWVRKAWESAAEGATVVCLVPARTDTKWWHEATKHASSIRFVKGRLKFGDSSTSAPFPSAVLVFLPPVERRHAQGCLFPEPHFSASKNPNRSRRRGAS